MKKYLIILSIVVLFPSLVSAKKNWAITEEGDRFSVKGECSGAGKEIDLFGKVEDVDPLYVFDVQCSNGEFYFSSDPLKNNIPAGNYIIAVDGEKNWNTVSMKKEETNTGSATGSAPNPDVIFLVALAGLQQSLLDMQMGISNTTYPKEAINSLNMTLSGMQSMASKIADTLWSADNPGGDFAGKVAGWSSEENEKTPVVTENLQAKEEQQTQQIKTLKESGIQALEKQQVWQSGAIFMDINSLDGLDFLDSNK